MLKPIDNRRNTKKTRRIRFARREESKTGANAPEMQKTKLAAVTARSGQSLFHLLALDGVGLITAEDEELAITEEFGRSFPLNLTAPRPDESGDGTSAF